MNWNQIKSQTQQIKSIALDHWDWFIDEQLDAVNASQYGSSQKVYAINEDEAESRLSAWQQQQRAKLNKSSELF